jgi:hypothetical protein
MQGVPWAAVVEQLTIQSGGAEPDGAGALLLPLALLLAVPLLVVVP